jgi:hypothetical protein
MQKVSDLILYHWHTFREKPSLEIGTIYSAGESTNRFWQFYERCSLRFQRDPYKGKYASALLHLFIKDNGLENKELTKSVFSFLHNAVYEMGMFIRELIFEEVRRSHFYEHPSRRTCAFLCKYQDVDYWGGWFPTDQTRKALYELSCNGKVHCGHQAYLDSDSMNYAEYFDNATNYWKGLDTAVPSPIEVLFEGTYKICRLVKVI